MTDLRSVHYFLGIKMTHTSQGMFLSQQRYTHKLLEKAKMTDCKLIQKSIVVFYPKSEVLEANPDVSYYKMLVGSLQYLTISRPDIAFAINSV